MAPSIPLEDGFVNGTVKTLSAQVHDVSSPSAKAKTNGVNGTTAANSTNGANTSNGVIRDHEITFTLEDHPVDQPRQLSVAVIGAGISGITAGALLPKKVPGIKLTIIDKNRDVGGTWLENVYPGVRCDVPAHTYQSIFEPNTQWTEEFATGPEIEDYWRGVARKYGVYDMFRPNTLIERAEWDETTGKWILTGRSTIADDSSRFQERFDFVVSAIGRFNEWRMPDYPGQNEYQGLIRHTSNWDPTFDPTGKRVAVIGNGASGLQVVPELQPIVKHLDHYARNPTWITPAIGGAERKVGHMYFSEEQKKEFEDPDKYLQYRKELEAGQWRRFAGVLRGSQESQNARELMIKVMKERLVDKPELLEFLIPDFSPSCRRLTAGPGYLEALTKDNVSYITTHIKRFTKTGIETKDGTHREADAVICSTGANIRGEPPFPIVSGDVDLSKAWAPDGLWGFPYSYLGISTPGFPNMAFLYGPSGVIVSGTTSINVENQFTYIAKMLRKMSTEGIKSMAPSKAATDDYIEYCDRFFEKTVMSENCSSWYNGGKPGGRIHALWPGSQGHFNFVRRNPRWEDWEYTLLSKSRNRFGFLGNGWTTREQDPQADLTEYLKKPEDIDLRDLHERWYEL